MSLSLPCLDLEGDAARRPLVVLLGLPSSPDSSRRLLERLADGRPLLAVSPTGPASGADPNRPVPSWPRLVAWLIASLDERGFEQVDMLGWSHGGAWVLQTLACHPDRVRRAVLAVSCARFRARERGLLELLRALLLSPIDDARLHAGLLPMLFSPDFLHRPGAFALLQAHLGQLSTSRAEWAAQLDCLINHDVRAILPKMGMVHTVIAGTKDWLFPASESRLLADALPNARLELLDSGHGVWFEAEQEFVELIHRALNEPQPGEA